MGFILADGGIETALVDRLGQTLPEFAAFVLLSSERGREALRAYYEPYVQLAAAHGVRLACDTPTWRANPDWGDLLGYDAAALDLVQAEAVRLLREVAAGGEAVLVSGCVGPRFDDFVADQRMSPETARSYHAPQVRALAAAGVDRIVAVTMIDVPEALGVVQAARASGCGVAVSFAVGADGLLPSGNTLSEAIEGVDQLSGGYPVGYLVNCAHPSEVFRAVRHCSDAATGVPHQDALQRIIGLRLNAAVHGDDGVEDAPEVFSAAVVALREVFPSADLFGGCCGTDVAHVRALHAAISESG